MKPFALFACFILLWGSAHCQNSNYTGLHAPTWNKGSETMPGNIKAFTENKGQYANPLPNDTNKVIYAYNYNGIMVFFTRAGMIYSVPEFVREHEDKEQSKDKEHNNGEEDEEHTRVVLHYIVMQWERANTLPDIKATDTTPYTFGSMSSSHKGIDNIKGFKKITYHNLYKGADVEFSFSEAKGIKYSIKLKPGYDGGMYSVKYSSPDQRLTSAINAKGQLSIRDKKLNFEICDAAPKALQNGKQVTCAYNSEDENEFSFSLEGLDAGKPTIIDPLLTLNWTNNITSVVGFNAFDLAMDQASNTYLFGIDNTFTEYVQQYSTSGGLNWTYTLSQYSSSISPTSVADMVCDKAGNTYIPSPFEYRFIPDQWALVSLNSIGGLRYIDSAVNNNIFETWNIAYSCNYATLVQAGASAYRQDEVSTINPANGSLNPIDMDAGMGEIYAGCFASNNYYYAMTAATALGGDMLNCYDVSSGTPVLQWSDNVSYLFIDYSFKYFDKIPTNGIASGCGYIYTSDGLTLDQRNLSNGNIVHSVSITGGSNNIGSVNSGLAVDDCGNVYAGSNKAIYIYDENLNYLGSYTGLPGIVLDAKYSNGLLTVCGDNPAFITQFATSNCVSVSTVSTNTSCNGNSGSATVNPPSLCASNPPYSYSWLPGGQTTQTISGLVPGLYTVTVTDASCPGISNTAVATVQGEPGFTDVISATPSSCSFNNGSIQLTPSGGSAPYTYAWSNGATTQNLSNLSAGVYTCTITDNLGCTFLSGVVLNNLPPVPLNVTPSSGSICKNGGSVSLSATGYSTYTWKPAVGLSCTNCANPTASPTVNTTYTVIGTNGGCVDSNFVPVSIVKLPYFQYYEFVDSCLGATEIELFADSVVNPNLTYSWAPDTDISCIDCDIPTVYPTVPTTYTATITYQGCSDTVQIPVTPVPPLVKITITASPTSVCRGDSTTLSASASTPYINEWDWPPAYAYCSHCSSIKVAPTVTTTYTVYAYDYKKSCWGEDSITVPMFDPGPISGYFNICEGSSVTLTAQGAVSYLWSTGAISSSITVYPTVSSTYSVVESQGHCTDTEQCYVTVSPGPPVSACCNETIKQGQSVQLTATGGTNYSWGPSYGLSCLSCPNPVASPNITTMYTVAISTDSGCVDEQLIDVTLEGCGNIFVPNAFSPNGDRQNDVLYVRSECIKTMDFFIYDRWGNRVFETQNLNTGWDGRYRGQLMNTGTYVWYLNATLFDGTIISKKGNVALVR